MHESEDALPDALSCKKVLSAKFFAQKLIRSSSRQTSKQFDGQTGRLVSRVAKAATTTLDKSPSSERAAHPAIKVAATTSFDQDFRATRSAEHDSHNSPPGSKQQSDPSLQGFLKAKVLANRISKNVRASDRLPTMSLNYPDEHGRGISRITKQGTTAGLDQHLSTEKLRVSSYGISSGGSQYHSEASENDSDEAKKPSGTFAMPGVVKRRESTVMVTGELSIPGLNHHSPMQSPTAGSHHPSVSSPTRKRLSIDNKSSSQLRTSAQVGASPMLLDSTTKQIMAFAMQGSHIDPFDDEDDDEEDDDVEQKKVVNFEKMARRSVLATMINDPNRAPSPREGEAVVSLDGNQDVEKEVPRSRNLNRMGTISLSKQKEVPIVVYPVSAIVEEQAKTLTEHEGKLAALKNARDIQHIIQDSGDDATKSHERWLKRKANYRTAAESGKSKSQDYHFQRAEAEARKMVNRLRKDRKGNIGSRLQVELHTDYKDTYVSSKDRRVTHVVMGSTSSSAAVGLTQEALNERSEANSYPPNDSGASSFASSSSHRSDSGSDLQSSLSDSSSKAGPPPSGQVFERQTSANNTRRTSMNAPQAAARRASFGPTASNANARKLSTALAVDATAELRKHVAASMPGSSVDRDRSSLQMGKTSSRRNTDRNSKRDRSSATSAATSFLKPHSPQDNQAESPTAPRRTSNQSSHPRRAKASSLRRQSNSDDGDSFTDDDRSSLSSDEVLGAGGKCLRLKTEVDLENDHPMKPVKRGIHMLDSFGQEVKYIGAELKDESAPPTLRRRRLPEIPRLRYKMRDQSTILGGRWKLYVSTVKRFHLLVASRLGLTPQDWDTNEVYSMTPPELEKAAAEKQANVEHAAARKIQLRWRSMVVFRATRKLLEKRRCAATMIQSWWRRKVRYQVPMAKILAVKPVLTKAAARLQAHVRSWLVRRRLEDTMELHKVKWRMLQLSHNLLGGTNGAVVRIQAAARGAMVRKQIKKELAEKQRLVEEKMKKEEDTAARTKKSEKRSTLNAKSPIRPSYRVPDGQPERKRETLHGFPSGMTLQSTGTAHHHTGHGVQQQNIMSQPTMGKREESIDHNFVHQNSLERFRANHEGLSSIRDSSNGTENLNIVNYSYMFGSLQHFNSSVSRAAVSRIGGVSRIRTKPIMPIAKTLFVDNKKKRPLAGGMHLVGGLRRTHHERRRSNNATCNSGESSDSEDWNAPAPGLEC